MIPEIQNITFPRQTAQPSKTYKIDTASGRLVSKIDGKEAIRQAVDKILITERYAWLIYDWNYGIGLDKYIGKDFAYIKADIKKNAENAILYDDRVLQVNSVDVIQTGIDSMYIRYNISTTDGEITSTVKIAGEE